MDALRNTAARAVWAILALLACSLGNPVDGQTPTRESTGRLTYPAAPKNKQVDDYHGVKIADPYRWLEDLDTQETRQWVEAENKLTFAWLAQARQREFFRRRLTELWNYERYGVPQKKGG